MNENRWIELITAMHAKEHPTVLAITGGGSQAIGQLLQVPGGSRSVLEAIVPYSSSAMADWLGSAADQACSAPTARAIAMVSWMRARTLSPQTDPGLWIGAGLTASLVSDRPKRGEHRVHGAIQTASSTTAYSLVLAKGVRDRPAEELLAAQLLLLGLAEACQIDTASTRSILEQQLRASEPISVSRQQADAGWTDLLLGRCHTIGYPDSPPPLAVFPGAFNPPHDGHQRMAHLAATRLGHPVAYELSITNVDKPPLDFVEIDSRLQQLQSCDGRASIVLTDAPTFRAKSALFPGCTFVVGADTILRIADASYYADEACSFAAAIQQIANRGCRFLVFGREIEGRFRVLSDLDLPAGLRELCDEVSAQEFREDVSSSSMRTIAPDP